MVLGLLRRGHLWWVHTVEGGHAQGEREHSMVSTGTTRNPRPHCCRYLWRGMERLVAGVVKKPEAAVNHLWCWSIANRA